MVRQVPAELVEHGRGAELAVQAAHPVGVRLQEGDEAGVDDGRGGEPPGELVAALFRSGRR